MIGHSKSMLNQFIDIDVPSQRDIFTKIGSIDPSVGSYSGDEIVTGSRRTLDDLAIAAAYDAQMQREELSKTE